MYTYCCPRILRRGYPDWVASAKWIQVTSFRSTSRLYQINVNIIILTISRFSSGFIQDLKLHFCANIISPKHVSQLYWPDLSSVVLNSLESTSSKRLNVTYCVRLRSCYKTNVQVVFLFLNKDINICRSICQDFKIIHSLCYCIRFSFVSKA